MASTGPIVQLPVDSEFIENWDEYFLEIANAVKRKSKDPRCRVGAVIVKDHVVVATGFNGFARGVYDDPARLEDVDEKIRWICHAEHNAILNAARHGVALEGAAIYTSKFPCFACCNAIIQAGIKLVYTHDKKYWTDDPFDKEHTRKKEILHQAGIKVVAPFHPDFMPTERSGKVAASAAPTAKRAANEEATVAPRRRRRGPKAAKPETQEALWPVRKSIPGGKAEK